MENARKIDKRESIKVVTDNSVIDAQELPKLSLNARKLFYVAISQCEMHDKEFYTYEATPQELADLWGISRQEVYMVAEKMCRELMQIVITLRSGKKKFKMRHLFDRCDYDDDSMIVFKLHNEMTDLLLGLKKDFSKPLVWDFMKMRSPYSMAIWHLMQKEMHSFKPMIGDTIEFELTLEELRRVTGTENKLKQVCQFKERVLDKALREIKKNCFVDIGYMNIKRGRKIVGFRFTANSLIRVDLENVSHRAKQRIRKADLVRKRNDGNITKDEIKELDELTVELGQMHIEDFQNI